MIRIGSVAVKIACLRVIFGILFRVDEIGSILCGMDDISPEPIFIVLLDVEILGRDGEHPALHLDGEAAATAPAVVSTTGMGWVQIAVGLFAGYLRSGTLIDVRADGNRGVLAAEQQERRTEQRRDAEQRSLSYDVVHGSTSPLLDVRVCLH